LVNDGQKDDIGRLSVHELKSCLEAAGIPYQSKMRTVKKITLVNKICQNRQAIQAAVSKMQSVGEQRTTCGDAGGKKKNGEPCGQKILMPDTGLCNHHHKDAKVSKPIPRVVTQQSPQPTPVQQLYTDPHQPGLMTPPRPPSNALPEPSWSTPTSLAPATSSMNVSTSGVTKRPYSSLSTPTPPVATPVALVAATAVNMSNFASPHLFGVAKPTTIGERGEREWKEEKEGKGEKKYHFAGPSSSSSQAMVTKCIGDKGKCSWPVDEIAAHHGINMCRSHFYGMMDDASISQQRSSPVDVRRPTSLPSFTQSSQSSFSNIF
jgi:hypothetical protein